MKLITAISLIIFPGLQAFAQQGAGYERREAIDVVSYRYVEVFADPFATPEFEKQVPITDRPVTVKPPAATQIVYEVEPAILEMIKKHIALNAQENTVSGYRVQLFSGIEREASDKVKLKFLELQYDNVDVYQQYSRPDFRIRVGDFISRSEAELFCNRVRPFFPSAFVVPDKVFKPHLYQGHR